MTSMIEAKKIRRNFRYAVRGLRRVFREEQNFRIELLFTVLIVVLLVVLDLRPAERAVVALATVLVLVLELINSIFERLADLLKPRLHQYVEDIKDIMAGSVLVAAVGAAFIGVVVFWPHFKALFC